MTEQDFLRALHGIHTKNWPEGLSREVSYPLGEIPLSEHLSHWAQVQPDAVAIHYYGTEITWQMWNELADRCANMFAAHGIARGDRIAVFLPNCPQFHIAFMAILKLGAVHVPVSPLSTATELRYVLDDADARLLVTLDAMMGVARKAVTNSTVEDVFVTALSDMIPEIPAINVPAGILAPAVTCADAHDFLAAISASDSSPQPMADLDAPAALNYTGGTTGMPKGCVHTQRNMVFTGAANWSVTTSKARGVMLNYFPEFWIAGENAALIFPVVAGQTLVLMTRWDALGVLQAIEKWQVTATALIVEGAEELMDHPQFNTFDLTSLDWVRSVSLIRKLDSGVRRRWFDATGTILAEAAWGMTETHTSNTFTTNMQDDDFDLKTRPVFVGLPIPGTDFVIRSFDTGSVLPLGQEGEITLRTPALMKSYWRNPEATARAMKDGFLYTGDIGMIDDRGYLHYLGRHKDMLKVRGMSVFPSEIEAVLGQHPAVGGSAVVGRPDPHAGQVPVAFVQSDDADLTPEILQAWLSERMAKYKIPEIRLIDTLPMTATGKIRKVDLARIIESEFQEIAEE